MSPGVYDVHFDKGSQHVCTVPSTSDSLLIRKKMGLRGGYVVLGVRAPTFDEARENALEFLIKRT